MTAGRGGFVYQGKTLLSGIDPAGRADRAADALPLRDRTLYFCPSPLYGYGLERLLVRLRAEAPNSALLCVEADTALYDLTAGSFTPSAAAAVKLRITNISESAALCAFVRQAWGGRVFRRVEMIRLSGGWQLYPELYGALAEALRREIALDWGNALTLAKLGRRYFRNALRNLALLPRCPSIGEISFGAAPVLVLGAGPSLDPLLDGLAARFGAAPLASPAGRPFKIVCVDTCLPALRERNVRPDLAVILESQHWNLGDFIGSLGWDVPAAMDLSALPAAGRTLAGGVYLFVTPWTELRLFERLGAAGLLPASLPPLGSVGLCAVEIARRISRGAIIAGGIDFSFTLDSYHARSTPGHGDKLRRHNRLRSLLNAAAAFGPAAFGAVSKSGLPVWSNPAMRGYRDLFEREFAAALRLYDVSGSGLPLGIAALPPEAVYDALAAGGGAAAARETRPAQSGGNRAETLTAFLEEEQIRLIKLRSILTGGAPAEGLETLIDECDCLWAHFPDYAGAGGRRPGAGELAGGGPAALSFLKRLRAEIDPALALLERAREECASP